MPLYMQQVAYSPDAWSALAQNPEDRREAFGRLAESMAGGCSLSTTAPASTMW
jgi:hypothetical protein